MPSEQHGNSGSDLWISLEDAVKTTGVSKRNIESWVREGRIKREKKGGVVYLWVQDLAQITPLASPESAEDRSVEPEIIQPVPRDHFSSPTVLGRQISEKLEKGLHLQEELAERMERINQGLEKVEKGAIDEKTAKELSLLGNVFRAIHQQNREVSEALASQKQLLEDVPAMIGDRDRLKDEVEKGKRKNLTTTAIFSVLVVALLITAVGLGMYFSSEARRANEEKERRIEENRKDASRERAQLREEHNERLKDLKSGYEQRLAEIKREFEREEQLWQQKLQDRDRQASEQLERLEREKQKETEQLTNLYHQKLQGLLLSMASAINGNAILVGGNATEYRQSAGNNADDQAEDVKDNTPTQKNRTVNQILEQYIPREEVPSGGMLEPLNRP